MNQNSNYGFQPSFVGLNLTSGECAKYQRSIFYMADAFLCIESMTHMKLQKLCYYAKAWYLAIYGENIITEPFEAWVSGAVQPLLYHKYKIYGLGYIFKNNNCATIPEIFHSFAKEVYDSYGGLSGYELEQLNHTEMPWLKARKGLKPWQGSNNIINEKDMRLYYRSLM